MAEEKKVLDYQGLARVLYNLANFYAKKSHNHKATDISDFPYIPKFTSDLINDEGYVTTDLNTTYELVIGENGEIILQGSDGTHTRVAVQASGNVDEHNSNTSAHTDIREALQELTNLLHALADSDDVTLDQMSEIVAYIKSNKELIEAITTAKISVSDIVDNLETNNAQKPLSAAQGVVIKTEIDKLADIGESLRQAIMDSQADFNVSDEASPSFIKNKPDISGMIQESAENLYRQIINAPEIDVVVEETAGPLKAFLTSAMPVKLNINDASYAVIGGFASKALPETANTMWSGFGVHFNDDSYEFYNVAIVVDRSDLIISTTVSPINNVALYARTGDADEKFVLGINEDQRLTITKVGDTPVIQALATIEDVEAALPIPDWNEGYGKSKNYIANKTHFDGEEVYLRYERKYSESVNISKLALSQVGVRPGGTGKGCLHENSFLRIILDDQEYVIRPQSTDIAALLDITIEEIGASFTYRTDRKTYLYEVVVNFANPILAQHASFEYGAYVLKKLDEKFIPDTIVRTSDMLSSPEHQMTRISEIASNDIIMQNISGVYRGYITLTDLPTETGIYQILFNNELYSITWNPMSSEVSYKSGVYAGNAALIADIPTYMSIDDNTDTGQPFGIYAVKDTDSDSIYGRIFTLDQYHHQYLKVAIYEELPMDVVKPEILPIKRIDNLENIIEIQTEGINQINQSGAFSDDNIQKIPTVDYVHKAIHNVSWDNLQDKPFYKKKMLADIFCEGTRTLTVYPTGTTYGNYNAMTSVGVDKNLPDGYETLQPYVEINGVIYEPHYMVVEPNYTSTYVKYLIGNATLYNYKPEDFKGNVTFEDTGEPFLLSFEVKADNSTSYFYAYLKDVTAPDTLEYNFKLSYSVVDDIKAIDEEYLPETVALKSDIEEAIANINTGSGGGNNGPTISPGANNKYFTIVDSLNGYTYYITMRNGVISSKCAIDNIEVVAEPVLTTYFIGETFDPTGLEIMITFQDGVTKLLPIDNKWKELVVNGTTVPIVYVDDLGIEYKVDIEVNLIEFAEKLKDFEYVSNEDGTYTITDWKGTLDGVDSDIFSVPNTDIIKI